MARLPAAGMVLRCFGRAGGLPLASNVGVLGLLSALGAWACQRTRFKYRLMTSLARSKSYTYTLLPLLLLHAAHQPTLRYHGKARGTSWPARLVGSFIYKTTSSARLSSRDVRSTR